MIVGLWWGPSPTKDPRSWKEPPTAGCGGPRVRPGAPPARIVGPKFLLGLLVFVMDPQYPHPGPWLWTK
jgi:hypothetical protein